MVGTRRGGTDSSRHVSGATRRRQAIQAACAEATAQAETVALAEAAAGRAERELRRENARLHRQLTAVRGQYRRLEGFVSELEQLAVAADGVHKGRDSGPGRKISVGDGGKCRSATASGEVKGISSRNHSTTVLENHITFAELNQNQDPILFRGLKKQSVLAGSLSDHQSSIELSAPPISSEPWPHFSQPSLEQLQEMVQLIQSDRDAAAAAALQPPAPSPLLCRTVPPEFYAERSLVRYRRPPVLVRLQPVQQHQVSFNTSGQVALRALTAVQVADELHRQLPPPLVQQLTGVRVLTDAVYISTATADQVAALLRCRLTVRGLPVTLRDESDAAHVLLLTGVPHYVGDAGVLAVAAAFGTPRGLPERRIYRGVATGERLVRLRLNDDTSNRLPPGLTLAGLRLTLRLLPIDQLDSLPLDASEAPPTVRPPDGLPRSPPPRYSQAVCDGPGRGPGAPSEETLVKRVIESVPRTPSADQPRWAERPAATAPTRERAPHQAGYPVWPLPEVDHLASSLGVLLLARPQTNGSLVYQSPDGRDAARAGRRETAEWTVRAASPGPSARLERRPRPGLRELDMSLEQLSSVSSGRSDAGETDDSVSPQDGSELPWCGCWGNGCF
ncbi:uncharacterized protein LOC122370272 [Amphibalanus amphitrite]|uniref:uncharacterized protein LOC122370272 n=1 Tax=Amphibalanus amphitrite TaxID=1232801 RepID=UPI001C90C44C|nr:uncharacterized protein LOC122370272 [Amphibalanus amphitrite]